MGRKTRAKKPTRPAVSSVRSRRLTFRSSVWQRRIRAALLILGAVGVLAAGYAYRYGTAPVSVTAALSSAGNAHFVYATRQQETYSPACGCMVDKSERWRGITFAARRVLISNTTEAAQTAFWLMAAYPTKLDWSPTLFRHRVRVLRLALRDERDLTPEDIANLSEADGVEVLEDRTLPYWDAAALVTNRPIVAILPGTHPIAAYIPVENSRVSITQPESSFPADRSPPLIREDYPASSVKVGYEGNVVTGADLLAYPMIDLVGPEAILITDDPEAVLIAREFEGRINSYRPRDTHSVTAIIISSPFSTRISAMPLGDVDRLGQFSEPLPEPVPSRFREPDRPARPLGPNEVLVMVGAGPVELPTAVLPRRRGVLELAILESLSTDEYARLEGSLRESDTVSANYQSRAPELDHGRMGFRYPPIPPIGGFNVFGLLAQLTLHIRTGQIMIGPSKITIDVPSILELRDIQAFTPRHNVVPIPLIVSGQEQSLEFNLETTSKLSINGRPVSVEADRRRSIVEYAAVVAALVQGVAAVITIWPRGKSEEVSSH